jgi:carotenoid phi-ring synthase / carotenoid chi-ring synthase
LTLRRSAVAKVAGAVAGRAGQAVFARPYVAVTSDAVRPMRVRGDVSAVVVGGGIAGCVAATVLAERGVRVTLLEADDVLGGRLSARPHRLPDGSEQVVEHGFHAFFRQYYTLRAWLRRLDPTLSFLQPIADYPVAAVDWPDESFAGLPRRAPLNLIRLVQRSPSITFEELRAMDGRAATPLLAYDAERTYREFDDVSARKLLDSLQLGDRARAMLFEVFAHSFFNSEDEMSAAEMIAMFHFYFLGNPEGLLFDAPRTDYATCIWDPVTKALLARQVDVRLATRAVTIDRNTQWHVSCSDGSEVSAPNCVLALDVAALGRLLSASPAVVTAEPMLDPTSPALQPAGPYAVARFWFDGDVAPKRAPFTGVSRQPTLDSISVYSRLEDGARAWATRTGGSVVELHAYGTAPGLEGEQIVARMRAELAALWPETSSLNTVDVRWRIQANAPLFATGASALRPGVTTRAEGLRLAGDWVRTDFPTALMERAAATGVLAANDILVGEGAAPESVLSVPPRGLLAPLIAS